ncbi:MAG: hypothetical protein AAFQ80_07770 [Cyanobacteria bacterium J06621_8]
MSFFLADYYYRELALTVEDYFSEVKYPTVLDKASLSHDLEKISN